MKRQLQSIFILCILLIQIPLLRAQTFSLEAVRNYPFPSDLTRSAQGECIAWAVNEQGKRNVYVAEGPDFLPRKLTNYTQDDGQEISSLSISDDGRWVVYVRGGEHGSNFDDELPVNALSLPTPPKVQIWQVPFAGGDPVAVAEGDEPVTSPDNKRIAFLKGGQIWAAPLNGSSAAKILFTARGTNGSLQWSPDGSKLAFVSDRKDHAFVGVFSDEATPINWIAPSFARDASPRWSPDGRQLAFVRTAGRGNEPDSLLTRRPRPWSIWIADVATGVATQRWKSPKTLAGSLPSTQGSTNLHWAAKDQIVFVSYQDGWPHLYSMGALGGVPLLLTPGPFMVEHVSLSPDRQWLVFSANTGPDKLDIDRRHVARVPVDKAVMEVLTPGAGLEWTPVLLGDNKTVAMLSATAQRPPLPAVMPFGTVIQKLIGENLIPAGYPQNQLVTPRQVTFNAPDGTTVYGQLFEKAGGSTKKPSLIYAHGGPSRQMLLGWHYSDYYANAYAMNQWLANQGFVVLSVNYRLGIGYGYNFQNPANGGAMGASEYQDVKAGAVWLTQQPQIDAGRIGIFGGSYGGYLTALALARNSKLFAAGVDTHGVHDWNRDEYSTQQTGRFEKVPDFDKAMQVIYESSPISSVKTWTSPVLLIHGDDDRNVRFSQTTDLVQRLDKQGVPIETMVIVDDTHHWMRYANALRAGNATADFFRRKLMKMKP